MAIDADDIRPGDFLGFPVIGLGRGHEETIEVEVLQVRGDTITLKSPWGRTSD